jgi:hypothetical protein
METAEKVRLFRSLFDGRQDVYAVYWEDLRKKKKGYAPGKNRDTGDYNPLTDEVVLSHMRGKRLVGIYPMRPDNTVRLFAVDFDDHKGDRDALADAQAFYEAFDQAEFPVYLERSKSATGYHVWGFFDSDVVAWQIRGILYARLRSLNLIQEGASEQSTYDRIFPNQDRLSGKGLGNLIALPLNGKYAKSAAKGSLFIDPDSLARPSGATLTPPPGVKVDRDEKGRPTRTGFAPWLRPFEDQIGFLGTVRRISASQVAAAMATYDVVQPGKQVFDEPITRQARPGIDRVVENCDFIKHCKAEAERLSEPLWHAMVVNLASFDGSEQVIHQISSPHPDYRKNDTQEKIDRAREALREVGPHTCAKLATIGFPCQRNCLEKHGYKSPASWGKARNRPVLEDVLAEIENAVISSDSARAEVARALMQKAAGMAPLELEMAIDALSKKTKFSLGLLRREMESIQKERYKTSFVDGGGGAAFDPDVPLFQRLQAYKAGRSKSQPFDPHIYAGVVHDWFTGNGGQYFFTPDEQFLFFRGEVFVIGDNLKFNALLDNMGHLSRQIALDRCVWDGLQSRCITCGRRIRAMTWSHTDRLRSVVTLALNRETNNLVEMSPGKIREIPNGSNDSRLLLAASDKMDPVVFDPDVDVPAAMRQLKNDFIASLACSVPDAYMMTAWAFCSLIMGYTPKHPLMKLSGSTKSGKTTAARLFSHILYGNDTVKSGTTASVFSDGARNPFQILDNIENRNMREELLQFLLIVSTGAVREKRKLGTDRDNVQERLDCLVVITAIEPFVASELINRTYDLEFHTKYQSDRFMEPEVTARLQLWRSRILSAVMHVIAHDVLPNMGEGSRSKLIKQSGIRSHPKDRTQDYFVLMLLLLQAMWQYIAPRGYSFWSLVSEWLESQARIASETELQLNPCLYHLDGLESRWRTARSDTDWESKYGIKPQVEDGIFWFECTTSELFAGFCVFDRETGQKAAFDNPRQLGQRLKAGEKTLNGAGWRRREARNRRGVMVWRYAKEPKVAEDARQVSLLPDKTEEEDGVFL